MSDTLKNAIGPALAAARKTAGLSQEDLARRINRHKDSISHIERRETIPTLPMLYEIADALGVQIADLLPSQTSEKSLPPTRVRLEAEVVSVIRSLPDDRLEYLRDHLDLLRKLK